MQVEDRATGPPAVPIPIAPGEQWEVGVMAWQGQSRLVRWPLVDSDGVRIELVKEDRVDWWAERGVGVDRRRETIGFVAVQCYWGIESLQDFLAGLVMDSECERIDSRQAVMLHQCP